MQISGVVYHQHNPNHIDLPRMTSLALSQNPTQNKIWGEVLVHEVVIVLLIHPSMLPPTPP